MAVSRVERGSLVILAGVPGVGSMRISQLVGALGSAQAALRARPTVLSALPGFGYEIVQRLRESAGHRDPEAALTEVEKSGISVVLISDDEYPEALRQIHNPPQVLFVRGRFCETDAASVAVVGARNCTEKGRWVAERLAEDLAGHGLTVVSGLARGIDAAAHRGALRSGRTIAVLGSGVDSVYPRSNLRLATEVSACGALVSEYAPNAQPRPGYFPARNRIISGLSLGTVVVEATEESGAMITAAFAAQQNREVFAVPGDTRLAGSRGPHRLIKEGAKLVETVADILVEFSHLRLPSVARDASTEPNGGSTPGEAGPLAASVLRLLSAGPCSVEEVASALRCGIPKVTAELSMLELDGRVRPVPGGRYTRC